MTLWAYSRLPGVVLFNNTPQTIISDCGEKSLPIEPYTCKEVKHPTEQKKLTIKIGPSTYAYDTKPAGYDYVEWGLSKDRLYF